jgi:hypothetical protein
MRISPERIHVQWCTSNRHNASGSRDQLYFRTRRWYYSVASHWKMILWFLLVPIATSCFMMARQASFIEANAPNYNRQAELDSSLPIFAVLGATGVGKSSFIARLDGRHLRTNELPSIGHRLQSREYSFQLNLGCVNRWLKSS